MSKKTKPFSLSDAKKFLNKKGLELFKKSNQVKRDGSFKNLSYTLYFSFLIIILFSISPKVINLKNNYFIKSNEVKNNSKIALEKVLTGKDEKNNEQDSCELCHG